MAFVIFLYIIILYIQTINRNRSNEEQMWTRFEKLIIEAALEIC